MEVGICVKQPSEVGILGGKVGGTLNTAGSQLNMAAGVINIEGIFCMTRYNFTAKNPYCDGFFLRRSLLLPLTYLSARGAI